MSEGSRAACPTRLRRRQHRAADITLSFAKDVDKGFAIQGQRHSAPQIGVVEGWRMAVEEQLGADISRSQLAARLRRLTFDILSRKRLAVVPFDALAQAEMQLRPVFAP